MQTATQDAIKNQDVEYDAFIQRINDRFNAVTGPIFRTDVTGLYAAYLDSFEKPVDRQYHTCATCQHFIEQYGGLAQVVDGGLLQSVLWDEGDAPENYKAAVFAMARLVRRAAITMPFVSSEELYGTPESAPSKKTGIAWHHFAVRPSSARIFRATPLKTAHQFACEKREEFATVKQALKDWPQKAVETALRLLKDDQLGNSEAVVAQAQFLNDLHGLRNDNQVFRAVAMAPSGFCHPRSSMIATLLDDIVGGASFETARAKWNAKMHPGHYQRPQAAPTPGAIKAAEEAFAKLGAASALKRRYATLDDVLEKLWTPKTEEKPVATGVFASVKPKAEVLQTMMMVAPAVTMTWTKFAATVLPEADAIDLLVPYGHSTFSALTTAVDPDAVPLLQWDSVDHRNPVANFMFTGGSLPGYWGLNSGHYHRLTAITRRPSEWFGGDFPHQPQGVLLILDGARPSSPVDMCLFPSILRSEYRDFRSVIEAYSGANKLEGVVAASACGLMLDKGESYRDVILRVTRAGQVSEYRVDRWD